MVIRTGLHGGHVNGARVSVNHGYSSNLDNVHSKCCAQKEQSVLVSHHLSPLLLSRRLSHISNTAEKGAMFRTSSKITVQADNLMS